MVVRGAFPKIRSREDAAGAIEAASLTFLVLTICQTAINIALVAANREPDAPLLTGVMIDALSTAGIFIVLTILLYRWRSRIIAVVMFLLIVILNGWRLAHGPVGALGGVLLMVGLWAGIRAMQATVKFHYFRRSKATVSSRPTKDYDVEKWEALLKKGIGMVAQKLRPLGEKWVDEFARAFLILNDKQYLPDIVQRIIADAKEEAERAERAARARRDWHSSS
jgi:hypothetical protein